MIFVSYYTLNTPYAEEAEELRKTLNQFGVKHEIYGIPSEGSWVRNCGRKPWIVAAALAKHPGRAVVFIDADARLKQPPVLFDALVAGGIDFAAHWCHGVELASGTLFFGNTATSRNLVLSWMDDQRRSPDAWDQVTLLQSVMRYANLRTAELPAEYCAIFDLGECKESEAVVWHGQASRRLQAMVNEAKK